MTLPLMAYPRKCRDPFQRYGRHAPSYLTPRYGYGYGFKLGLHVRTAGGPRNSTVFPRWWDRFPSIHLDTFIYMYRVRIRIHVFQAYPNVYHVIVDSGYVFRCIQHVFVTYAQDTYMDTSAIHTWSEAIHTWSESEARCRRKEGRSQGCRGCRPLHWWEAQEAAQAGGERLSQESDNAGSLWQIRMYPDWTACGCIPNLGVPSASVLHISRMYRMVYRVGIR